MVAGPLVAIGVMMPGGHHEIMGRAEPALMMLFNIFLRPSLMIMGLMAGMLISTVLCDLIFYTFWQIFIPKAGEPGLSVLAWVFYMGAFVALVVAAVNKSYAAIYMLPDRVITWIGGHAGQGGEAEMAGEAKHAVEGGARGMGGAAQTMGGAVKGTKEAKMGQDSYDKKAGGGDAAAAEFAAKTKGDDEGSGGGAGGGGSSGGAGGPAKGGGAGGKGGAAT
jgi:defect-in-organelle-trafficking protein DotA